MTARDEAERAIAGVLDGHRESGSWRVPITREGPIKDSTVTTSERQVKCSCGLTVASHSAHVASVLADLMAGGLAKAWDEGHGTTCDGIHEKTWSLDGCEQYNPYRLAPEGET